MRSSPGHNDSSRTQRPPPEAQPHTEFVTVRPPCLPDAAVLDGAPCPVSLGMVVHGPSWHEANSLHGYHYGRAYESPSDAIERIRIALSASPDRLRSWMLHPDPSVPVAMLEAEFIKMDRWIQDTLYQRAMRDAVSEGVVWTPLLDALSTTASAWPTMGEENPDRGFRRYWAVDEPELPQRFEWRDESRQLADLISWIEHQSDPKSFRPLFQFRSPELLTSLAATARVFDDELARRLTDETTSYPTVVTLIKNPYLPPEMVEQMQQWAVDQAVGRLESTLFGRTVTHSVDPWGLLAGAAEVGRHPSRRMFEELLAASENPKARSILTEPVIDTPREILARLVATGRTNQFDESRIILHPRADVTVWRATARATKSIDARIQLAYHDQAPRDPEVRKRLSRSTSPSVLSGIIRFASDKEAARLFRRLLKTKPGNALVAIISAGCTATDEYVAVRTLPASLLLELLDKPGLEWRAVANAALLPVPWPTASAEEVARIKSRSRDLLLRDTDGLTRADVLEVLVSGWPGLLDVIATQEDIPKLLGSESAPVRTAAIVISSHAMNGNIATKTVVARLPDERPPALARHAV